LFPLLMLSLIDVGAEELAASASTMA